MVKYVVFAGNGNLNGNGNDKNVPRSLGFLDCLVEEGLLDSVSNLAVRHSFINDDNFDWFLEREFGQDKTIRKVLSGMELPKVYSIVRAVVSNGVEEQRLKDVLEIFKNRYGLDYSLYEY